MARPTKQGVDYFPLDVYLDDKFKFIEIKYKLEGFAILIKIIQKIYSYGYWYKWSEDETLLFSDEIRADFSLVEGVVNEAINRGIFDKEMHEKHKILTSKGIQKRYKEMVRRRKDVEVKAEYLLIDNIIGVIDDINSINDDIKPSLSKHDDGKSTQSKVNKTKVNKTKKEDSKKHYAEFVTLTQDEYTKLLEQFGEQGTKDRIENLNLYKGSKGIKYKSDYLTVLSWERKNTPKINAGTHTKQNAIDFNRLEALLEDE
jgi:hypothetical protein